MGSESFLQHFLVLQFLHSRSETNKTGKTVTLDSLLALEGTVIKSHATVQQLLCGWLEKVAEDR